MNTTGRDETTEVWYENGLGLLDEGWYASDDDRGRRGPFETKAE
jgi:hypothetical protein